MASDLLRFDKGTGKLFLKGANGEQQIVAPPETTNRTVFVLVDASGSMAIKKFEDATKGALDFGLVCIGKRYQVGVIVLGRSFPSDIILVRTPRGQTVPVPKKHRIGPVKRRSRQLGIQPLLHSEKLSHGHFCCLCHHSRNDLQRPSSSREIKKIPSS